MIDTGLMSVLLVARYFGIAVAAEQLVHQFGTAGKPFGDTEVLRAARHLGLKAGKRTVACSRLASIPCPAIAQLQDGQYMVLARVDGEQVLIHDPREARALSLPRPLFEGTWNGTLILLTTRLQLRAEARQFGFAWFVPALFKYRWLLGEVLLASFFLQVFALLTPLFFQVVIDKVLVHKGLTTLHVLTLGMVGLAVFEAILGGLRTYVFSHTSCRIDVSLGAQLFQHILHLPLAYFQARRVGDTVARARELETIRQFLTGSTVTVALDHFFATVFLVVMLYYSVLLTAVVGGSLLLYAGLSAVVTPLLRARLQEKFYRGAEQQAFLVETISGIETVKAMAVEPAMQRRWDEQLAEYIRAGFRAQHLRTMAGQGASWINRLTTIALVWLGADLVMSGQLTS
jgi:subfamily B ATP-binding cassette protein HlyB/CyaB